MEVVPAVDLLGEDAVRLYRGDFDRPTWRRPAFEYVARLVAAAPIRLHVVDLDGARTGRIRAGLIERVVRAAEGVPVQVSGGVRSVAAARSLISAGADRVVISTAAFAGAPGLPPFVTALGERLVVALDVRAGRIAVRGWLANTEVSVAAALRRCVDAGVARLLCTAVDRDGTLAGPDVDLLTDVVAGGVPVMAAGGVRSRADLDALAGVGCEAAIVGTAIVSNPEALLT